MTDPTAKLNALTEELRVTTAVLRSEFSPEVIRQLTPAQRAVLRRELLKLRGVSQRVASDIAAHLTGEAEYHPATREEIDAVVARHEPHDYGEDRGVHAPLPRDRGQAGMTDRLQGIRERHDAIIPGPWDWFGNTVTDQVFLATTDRGRLFILSPGLRSVEYVYDNLQGEGYELDEARQRVHTNWCLAHAEHVDKDDPGECICDEIRDFLRGELDHAEGHRYFEREDRGYRVSLMRAVQVFPDLRFVGPETSDAFGGRKRQGGMIRSYREIGVRYEVLGHATLEEFEQRQKLIDAEHPPHSRELRPTAKQALYREDFRGIASPEAEFIAAAPEDIDYLLKRLEAAEEHIEALQQLCMWENRGQALQGTVDARALAATTLACWEGNQ